MTEIIDPVWTCSEAPEEPGEEITLEGWAMSYGAGGCLRASGTVDAEVARRCKQGWELKAYVGGRCVWSGPISASPLVYRGTAELAAEGWVSKATKASGRLLYQSRDVSSFVLANAPPHSYTTGDVPGKIDPQQGDNQLMFRHQDGVAIGQNEGVGFLFWAPGTPGGISRVAFSITKSFSDNNWIIQLTRATGPAGALTTVVNVGLGAGVTTFDQTITSAEDLIRLFHFYSAAGNPAMGAGHLILTNLRVNGIAPSATDPFTTSQVVTDILGRLGFDTSGVQSSGVNALPYDLKDGNWFSGLEYMAFLDDRPVVNIVPADDGTRMGVYRPWGKVVHDISLENAEPELNSLPLYNGVTVSYPHVGGFTAQVTIRPSDIGASDPLAGTDADNILAISLSDAQPQPDAALATAHGQAVMARLLNAREEGTFVIPSLMPGDALHGDHLNVSDWAPLEARELPINSIEFRQGQPARVSIYSPGGELGLAARFGLQQARLIQNPALPAIEVAEAADAMPEEHAHCHTHSSTKSHHKEPKLPKGKKSFRHNHTHSHEKVKQTRHKQEPEPCD